MRKILVNIITVSFLILSGCLKDAPITQATTEQNNSADILIYLEAQGDYINSPLMPSLIKAGDVFGNPDDKIILDVRSTSDFTAGHIQNAINIKPSDILNFVKTADPNKTVVIVSLTGQSASYYTGLLRLDGFINVYALKYGMASWNMDFAGHWIANNQQTNFFTNLVFNKPPVSALPEITFTNSEGNIKEKINTIIQELMSNTFSEDDVSDASISTNSLLDIYSTSRGDYLNTFVVCYAQNHGEYILGSNGALENPGHLPTAVYYQANNFGASDLRSTAFLQTIPNNKDIVVYSRIAHLSAFITAYLRLLGYRAKSLLFGIRWRVGFSLTEVQNYPYVTGT
ncbi:MAG: rhodanese-like domain-containing protein [Bacteroidetes bacterium]|nr:rhodanese-like domain-containing protein [Bacteroidota bacterium]